MRTFAVIDPRFWTLLSRTGTEIRRAGLDVTALALYLVTSPHSNALGVYYLPLAAASAELGVSLAEVRRLLEAVCATGFAQYFETDSMIWIPEMARYQIGESMKPRDHRRQWALRELRKVEGTPAHGKFLERYGEAYGLLPRLKPPVRLVPRGAGGEPPAGDRMAEARKLGELLERSSHEP